MRAPRPPGPPPASCARPLDSTHAPRAPPPDAPSERPAPQMPPRPATTRPRRADRRRRTRVDWALLAVGCTPGRRRASSEGGSWRRPRCSWWPASPRPTHGRRGAPHNATGLSLLVQVQPRGDWEILEEMAPRQRLLPLLFLNTAATALAALPTPTLRQQADAITSSSRPSPPPAPTPGGGWPLPPYPRSTFITNCSILEETMLATGVGGDTWPSTWSQSGQTFAMGCDNNDAGTQPTQDPL